MYLTRLDVLGFKSFAQKAVFKFDGGMTAIIGPNGCGKSNIVDAIRWVLGEQRPSVLRCDRMDNVIFNGTATRKPLSMAEVSIYIENNKNILPSEYTEIKITRRLYRSGESEYLINNQVVRLMDIINLFADTGMGADAYSVIELKMVEQILSDNAQERRRLFEEASGIKKYKARRKSALNKLDTTQQELTRLDDIIAEVQKSVNSLARQVGKARRYHEYRNQLKEKELLYSYLKIYSLQNELKPLRTELDEVSRTRTGLGKEVHRMEAEMEKLQVQAVDMEQSFRLAAENLYQKDELIQEARGKLQLRQQKIESLQDTVTTYEAEIEQQKQRRQQLSEEKDNLQSRLQTIRQNMQNAQEVYRQAANQQLEAEEAYRKMREAYQSFIQTNREELQQSGVLKEAQQKINLQKENLIQRIEGSRETREKLNAELQSRQGDLQNLTTERENLQNDLDIYTKEHAHLEAAITQLKTEMEALRKDLTGKQGELEKLLSRKSFLENLINNYEGFSGSVQYVMSNKTRYRGIVDTLANLVDCEAPYRQALESYLMEVSNYLVVEEEQTAKEILESLRRNSKGRLTLVPLTLLNANHRAQSGESLPPGNETMRPLREVVNFSDEHAPLFHFLFRGVYLVDDLDQAITLHRRHPNLTFVTREGDILEYWGNLTGGMSQNGVGLIGRKEQYQKCLNDLNALRAEIQIQEEKLQEVAAALGEKESKLEEFKKLRRETEQQLFELDKRINQFQYEITRLSETAARLTEEIEAFNETLGQLELEASALQPEIQQQSQKLAAYQQEEEQLLEKLQEHEAKLKELTAFTQEKQIEYLNLTSEEKELTQKLEFVEQSIEDAGKYIEDRLTKITQYRQQVAELSEECQTLEENLTQMYQERDDAEEQKNKVEQHLQELKSVIQMKEVELKKRQRLWNQARERVQELELKIREIEVKLEALEDQVKEKYGDEVLNIDIKELDPSLTLAGLQDDIQNLRNKLESLGDVNPLAIKEHEKEKERLNFLTTQKEDLLSARDQLLETIHQLNTTARKLFMETFEKIQVNFQKVFQEFFEDGKAELVLVESRDPLEANIDIKISHKGKNLNTLSLLSAGEKTLTAISLLFAIYLVKPSPFCILDEVDAPLDDINITRFTSAIRQFTKDTQFIIVTHNKKSMEAVNTLYGVTMEEQGVSKVVSVKLD